MKKEAHLNLIVYLALVALTLLTAGSFYFGFGPVLGVVFALMVASMKASLIGYYFMHMKDDGALIYGIALVGVFAVLILAVGILPDMGLQLLG